MEFDDIEEHDSSRDSIKKSEAGSHSRYSDVKEVDISLDIRGKKGRVDGYMHSNGKLVVRKDYYDFSTNYFHYNTSCSPVAVKDFVDSLNEAQRHAVRAVNGAGLYVFIVGYEDTQTRITAYPL
ncbi:hypothetical protein M9H77_18285 [Catharanthus roseus]|uniref:Uncharacterized protein n=1 Tax=Catharanthus roseus TaxID=4058 RepID=A0ACC0B701_CATRO|nr:hypothetical protein M9H77_18285 [Catharanthus roseus]